MVGHTGNGGLAEIHPNPLPSLHGREGSSFPGSVPPSDTVDSGQWSALLLDYTPTLVSQAM